jgi:hypothetical protein
MRSGTSFRLIVLILLVPSMALCQQSGRPSIADSPKGFDTQYKNLFKAFEKAENSKAYQEENGQAVLERFRTFAIPEDWFTQTFAPEERPKLAKHYSELFRAFERSTIYEFRMVLGEWSAQVQTTARGSYPVNPLLTLPPVQLFRIQHFTAPLAASDGTLNGRRYNFAWAEYFIYLDGSFRFAGSYNCPFWRPCSTNDPVFRDQLVRRDAGR